MVPPAISVIYCHLRWQDGSPWHWPLTDPTFCRGRRIELGVTPLSDIRIHLRGWAGAEEENNGWILLLLVCWKKGRMWWSYTTFCLPQEVGEFSALVYTHWTSLCVSSSFPLPSVSFHISKPKQTPHVVVTTFPVFEVHHFLYEV